jgi:hypothetical protein
MAHFVGLEVSVQETSVCVVDDAGKVLCVRKVSSAPVAVAVEWFDRGWASGRVRRDPAVEGLAGGAAD